MIATAAPDRDDRAQGHVLLNCTVPAPTAKADEHVVTVRDWYFDTGCNLRYENDEEVRE